MVKNGSAYEYQYALTDHQGNTRLIFSAATPAPLAISTNMEAASDANFPSSYGNRVNFNLFDHTDPGLDATDYSQKLTGGNNSQVGVSKSYKVYPGDKVKIEAWAKYQNPTSNSSSLSGFAATLFAAFGVPAPIAGETGTVSSALNTWGGLVASGNSGSINDSTEAFVNIIVFDKNYKLLDAAWKRISPTANQINATPVVSHQYLKREYTIKEEGYVFIYVCKQRKRYFSGCVFR